MSNNNSFMGVNLRGSLHTIIKVEETRKFSALKPKFSLKKLLYALGTLSNTSCKKTSEN